MLIFTPYTQFQLGLLKMLKPQNWLNEIENLFVAILKVQCQGLNYIILTFILIKWVLNVK